MPWKSQNSAIYYHNNLNLTECFLEIPVFSYIGLNSQQINIIQYFLGLVSIVQFHYSILIQLYNTMKHLLQV